MFLFPLKSTGQLYSVEQQFDYASLSFDLRVTNRSTEPLILDRVGLCTQTVHGYEEYSGGGGSEVWLKAVAGYRIPIDLGWGPESKKELVGISEYGRYYHIITTDTSMIEADPTLVIPPNETVRFTLYMDDRRGCGSISFLYRLNWVSIWPVLGFKGRPIELLEEQQFSGWWLDKLAQGEALDEEEILRKIQAGEAEAMGFLPYSSLPLGQIREFLRTALDSEDIDWQIAALEAIGDGKYEGFHTYANQIILRAVQLDPNSPETSHLVWAAGFKLDTQPPPGVVDSLIGFMKSLPRDFPEDADSYYSPSDIISIIGEVLRRLDAGQLTQSILPEVLGQDFLPLLYQLEDAPFWRTTLLNLLVHSQSREAIPVLQQFLVNCPHEAPRRQVLEWMSFLIRNNEEASEFLTPFRSVFQQLYDGTPSNESLRTSYELLLAATPDPDDSKRLMVQGLNSRNYKVSTAAARAIGAYRRHDLAEALFESFGRSNPEEGYAGDVSVFLNTLAQLNLDTSPVLASMISTHLTSGEEWDNELLAHFAKIASPAQREEVKKNIIDRFQQAQGTDGTIDPVYWGEDPYRILIILGDENLIPFFQSVLQSDSTQQELLFYAYLNLIYDYDYPIDYSWLKPIAPEILPFIFHGNSNIRQAALDLYCRLDPPRKEMEEVLRKALNDSDEEVRYMAVRWVGQHRFRSLAPAVQQLNAADEGDYMDLDYYCCTLRLLGLECQ